MTLTAWLILEGKTPKNSCRYAVYASAYQLTAGTLSRGRHCFIYRILCVVSSGKRANLATGNLSVFTTALDSSILYDVSAASTG